MVAADNVCGYDGEERPLLVSHYKPLLDDSLADAYGYNEISSPVSAYPTTFAMKGSDIASYAIYLLRTDADWTGTPWEGHGGHIAVGALRARLLDGPTTIPAGQIWDWIAPEDGVAVLTRWDPAYLSPPQLCVRDSGETGGWLVTDPQTAIVDTTIPLIGGTQYQFVLSRVRVTQSRLVGVVAESIFLGTVLSDRAGITLSLTLELV
jgi:hypothetical protein